MCRPIAIRADVLEGIRARWPELAEPWSASVLDELHELCARHRAEPVAVLKARFGLVVKANSPDGMLVLRSSPDPEGRHQGSVSAALAELGVSPRIHEFSASDHATWSVMDFVQPGLPLGDRETMPGLEHIATMLEPMIEQPAPHPNLPNVVEWLRERLNDDHLRDLAPGRQVASPEERHFALKLLDELAADHLPGLCHGDASSWNILTGKAERLYLIDPRGISGEAAYDAAVIALKESSRIPIKCTVRTLSNLLGLSAGRILSWVDVAKAARV